MKLKMGEIYRCSNENKSADVEMVDGLPNYYYYTKVNNFDSTFWNQSGIHTVKYIKTVDGKERRPVIIAFSSPHKAGNKNTPWKDYFDAEHGYIKYYGDNKSKDSRPWEKHGNKELIKELSKYQSDELNVRKNEAVPIVFFERVKYNNSHNRIFKVSRFWNHRYC